MSAIVRTLQVSKWSKKHTFFSFREINATQFGTKIWFRTNVCSRKSATTFGDLPDWKDLLPLSIYKK